MYQIITTFTLYGLILIIVAAICNYRHHHLSDYLLAGRRLNGPMTAMGVGASDMSSWLLMALPGAVYVSGLSIAWMPIALVLGAYCNWRLVAARLRIYSEVASDALTLPSYLENRFGDTKHHIRLVLACSIIIFFTYYAVAGFISGAKLLQLVFQIDYINALLLSASVIVIYTMIGGFLAISWIDLFQGGLMFFALMIVPGITSTVIGGYQEVYQTLSAQFPQHLSFFNGMSLAGFIALFAWGLGYFGQPHIIIRFMAIKHVQALPMARRIAMTWMILALVGAILVGLFGRLYYQTDHLADPELVFIALSRELVNPWMTGILLSAVLSAIMSTVAALILMAATSVVEDIILPLYPKQIAEQRVIWMNRLFILLIACFAVWLASDTALKVLNSVAFPWCGLGASLGPVILLSLYWEKMSKQGAMAGILTGAMVVIIWELLAKSFAASYPDLFLPGMSLLPGFVGSVAVIILVSKCTEVGQTQKDSFNLMLQQLV